MNKSGFSTMPKTSKMFSVNIDGAMQTFASMKRNGIRPNLKTFSNLFYGCGRAKYLKLLETLVKDLKKTENGLIMDLSTYESYIFALVRCHELMKAKQIVEQMEETKDANLTPGATTLSLLL